MILHSKDFRDIFFDASVTITVILQFMSTSFGTIFQAS